jgi:hypothetical protein
MICIYSPLGLWLLGGLAIAISILIFVLGLSFRLLGEIEAVADDAYARLNAIQRIERTVFWDVRDLGDIHEQLHRLMEGLAHNRTSQDGRDDGL